MAKVSEEPLPAKTVDLLRGAQREGLGVLGLDDTAAPQVVVNAIDAFVDAWQEGARPPKETLDPEVAHCALGGLWGEQLVRQLRWDWAMVTFHEHGNSKAPGVLSPDRALAVYPIHFIKGCFQDPRVDCTVALAFNMLVGGKTGQQPAKGYFNVMAGVHRIVPKR